MTASRDDALDAFVAEAPLVRGQIVAFVDEFARSLPPGAVVLDAGAGTAPYRPLFDHCRYETHDWAKSQHRGAFDPTHLGDLSAGLDIEAAQYDAVLLTEVLEHVEDPRAALLEIRRVLRPGGRIGITVPFVGELHEEPYDFRRLTNHGITALLTTAGFTATEVRPLGGWFSTLSLVLQNQSISTSDAPRTAGQRIVGSLSLSIARAIGRVAPALDMRFDAARRLPFGWSATGTA